MFIYNIGDIIGIGLLVICVLIFIYKLGKYYYIKRKFKKCPKCGHETGIITENSQTFGDIESWEKIYCRSKYNKNVDKCPTCEWEYKLKF